MRIDINFKKTVLPVHYPMNKQINGFINTVLGKENCYHGTVSNHSVTTMCGKRVFNRKNMTVEYPEGGTLTVSSPDSKFMLDFIIGLGKIETADICGMELYDISDTRYAIREFCPNTKYDYVVTIDPIIVKDGIRCLTYKDDNFIDLLTEKSKKKLMYNGVSKEDADSLKIELCEHESNRIFDVKINEQHNISNRVTLKVYGKSNVRKMLYEMGLGKSTSFCFGSVKINDFHKEIL